MLIAGGDYAQGELKIIACVANDETMIQTYKDGKDLHVVTAATLNHMTYEELKALQAADEEKYDALRQGGKAGNFGLIYAMQAPGFVDYAWSQYGVIIPLNEATDFRDAFFKLYNRLPVYHEEYIAFAQEHAYVRNPLGRIRHLPMINSKVWAISSKEERRAINSPIQSTLSDFSLLAAAEAYKRGWHRTAPLFGMVHDQNLYYVPEDDPMKYCLQQKELMENLPLHKFGWTPQLQFTVDFKIGKNLGDLKKVKF